MESLSIKLKEFFTLMGFPDAEILIQEEHRKIEILIDNEIVRAQLPNVLSALDQILNIILHREGQPSFVVDINYYRKERERLISELARAAAHKAMITKTQVDLPAMNAYERRLVHVEIAVHPSLKTESVGTGKERRVVIKHLE